MEPPPPDAPLSASDWEDVDWDDLAPRLLLGARGVWKRMGMDRYRGAPTPEDLVHEAIASVLEGRRRTNGDVTLFNNLYWIMHSQAHAFVKRQRAANGHGRRFVGLDAAGAEHGPDPQWSGDDEAFRNAVLRLVADDDVMTSMVRVWMQNGPVPAHELSEMLDVPVNTIYARIRKFKRRLRSSPLWKS